MELGWSDEFPARGVSRDPKERSQRLRAWLSLWEGWRCEAERYLAAGEFVLVLTRYTGRGKQSGASIYTEGAHLWTLRDGRVIRLEVFSSRAKRLMSPGSRSIDLCRHCG